LMLTPDWNNIIEMRHEERIRVQRRGKTYVMYENENEIIGNQLTKNQEKRLASHQQDEESKTVDEEGIDNLQKELSPEIFDYVDNENIANTYDSEVSINENILRISAMNLAKLDESKYFGEFIPHFIKYKKSQQNNLFSCTNDDMMDIRGESG
ncbi:11850_t:CDS:2, partial [Funneliformis caledonium]